VSWYRFGGRRVTERERAEEMRAHIEMYAEQLLARGWPPDAAQREARLKFGNPRVKLEEVEALKRIPVLDALARDLRSAVRGLHAAPGFTAVVLIVLTLAMGASTAMFSLVDNVVLRTLPFDRPDRLLTFDRTVSGTVMYSPFSAVEFLAFRADRDIFEGLAAVWDATLTLRRENGNDPEILRSQRVSAEFFPVLRVSPVIGRAFASEDEADGRGRVAVISHGLWQRRFGSTPDILGKRLPANNGDVEIIGVMPPDFAYPVGAVEPTDLWMPYVIAPDERVAITASWLRLVARLKDGVTVDRAQARIDQIAASDPRIRTADGGSAPTLRTLQTSLTAYYRPWMLMLLAAVACVLMIACVNVATLLLVRSTVRIRELSIRSALGATRWDLARMLLAESLLLSIAGTALGGLVASWGVNAFRSVLPAFLPRLADVSVDTRVLVVSASAAIVTGLAFGVAPLVGCSRAIDRVLRENGRANTASGRSQWLRSSLIVAEVALAVVLSIGAGLFITSFARLMRVDIGLDYRQVLVADVRREADASRLARLLDHVRGIPGVEAAAIKTSNVPFSGSSSSRPIDIPGRDRQPAWSRGIGVSEVSLDYFRALRVQLRKGRLFTGADRQGSEPVVILNETAAKIYFPGEDPIGRVVRFFSEQRTIVGVVGDVRGFGPERLSDPESYLPMAQGSGGGGTLLVRTAGDTAAIIPQVKAAIWSEFPNLAIPPPRTLEQAFGNYIAQRRFTMLVLSVFGLLGLTIAGVGIYGVTAYVVAERTREIGIRMALGALSSTILCSVLGRALALIALGLVAGLGITWLLATSVGRFLFSVEPHDLRIYAAVCGVLVSSAFLAALFPARRAARVDPLVALRLE
jgi:putative ABC transport system permease protein